MARLSWPTRLLLATIAAVALAVRILAVLVVVLAVAAEEAAAGAEWLDAAAGRAYGLPDPPAARIRTAVLAVFRDPPTTPQRSAR